MTEENHRAVVAHAVDHWMIDDVLALRRQIDARLSVVSAIGALVEAISDEGSDRLHAIIAGARWIVGPQFDSFEYASNVALHEVAQRVLGARGTDMPQTSAGYRPDLLVLPGSTISLSATVTFVCRRDVVRNSEVLLIDMKNGRSVVDRAHIHETENYVDGLRFSSVLPGRPIFHAYVVGHKIVACVARDRSLCDDQGVFAHIHAITYSELVDGARLRLLNLRANVSPPIEALVGQRACEALAARPTT